DERKISAAVQRVKLSSWLERAWADRSPDNLLEGGRRQLDDFRKAETAAISAAAILHRPPQLLIDGDEISRRPCAGAIDQDGIAGVGQPGTEQILGMINCQGVGISTDPVIGHAEKVIQPVMPGDGRVAQ